MTEERLADLLERLDRERQEADAQYNAALTALDRACAGRPELPELPAALDAGDLTAAKDAWDILPAHASGGGLKGLVRRLLWKLIGPPVHQQRHFNAVVVNHLTRLSAGRDAEQHALSRVIAALGEEADRRVQLQSHLIQYLQTITLYVDTRDRSAGGGSMVLNAGLNALTDDWMKRWESLAAREERFSSRISSVSAALAELRAATALAQQTSISLKREVERVLATGPSPGSDGGDGAAPGVSRTEPDLEAFKYLGFENAFRGTPEEISRRLAEYVPKFVGLDDVLDVGCGRGEFLHLLRERGIRARGLDLNQSMVEEARARGLDAVRADALAYLLAQPDGSLGGVFASQVVEHLEPAYLSKLIEAAAHKIRRGGILVLETINPTCWVAFFESFIRDPTHVQPLHPDTLQFMLRASGFAGVEVEYKAPVPQIARLQAISNASAVSPEFAGIIDVLNQNVALLNGRLFGYQDYAVTGRK